MCCLQQVKGQRGALPLNAPLLNNAGQSALYSQEKASYEADYSVSEDYAYSRIAYHLVANGQMNSSFHLLNSYDEQKKGDSPADDAQPGSEGSTPKKKDIHLFYYHLTLHTRVQATDVAESS